jgi:hypothetical protein
VAPLHVFGTTVAPTIVTYTSGVNSFLDCCKRTGTPPQLTKVAAQERVVDLLDNGAQPATATTWLGALKRYATCAAFAQPAALSASRCIWYLTARPLRRRPIRCE